MASLQLDGFAHRLMEIVLDIGQRPIARMRGQQERRYLHPDEHVRVTLEHLWHLESQLRIGHDNRAGIDGSLHRISVIRNRYREGLSVFICPASSPLDPIRSTDPTPSLASRPKRCSPTTL